MKKHLVIPLLAALCAVPAAESHAIEFKAKGVWINMLEYGDGGSFVRKDRHGNSVTGWGRWGEDDFEAKTRVRLQLDAVASEALSGSIYFEIGAATWGRAGKGGALGTDGSNITKVKHAYLDWLIPGTDIRTRMGLQRIFLPDYASEASQVFDADVAGISVSVPFNETVGLTAFWARPFNDNWTDDGTGYAPDNYLDNVDIFGLVLPLTFDGLRLTPWAMLGMVGDNAFRAGNDYYGSGYGTGISPAWYALRNDKVGRHATYAYGTAFWAGLTGDITAADPFRLAWSANYGSFDSGVQALNRSGWYASLLAEYKLDWGTPGIYGWYSSGDDGNPRNGSERLPSFDYNNESTSGFSGFGTLGTWTIGRDAVLGYTLGGTWGIGARIRDLSFMDKLSHTIRVNFYNGTNAPRMARYIKGELDVPGRTGFSYGTDFYDLNTNGGIYLTQKDYAAEFGLMSSYQIYDNLRLLVEANYIALWLDQSSKVWGGFHKNGTYTPANSLEDAWNVNVSFIYKF